MDKKIKNTSNNLNLFLDIRVIALLVLALASFSTVSIFITWDLSGYMNQALNIVSGKGYIYTDGEPIYIRGPVFPLMIALSFKLFGASPESAFYVIRMFCIFNPVIIYLLGKKLFNADVGFAAALLIIFSYSLSYHSYRHLDAVWPFFAILHTYFIYEGFEKRKASYFVLAGISIGLAFLIKEVAMLFFPLAVLLILSIKKYRIKRNFKYLAVNFITLAVTLSPWIIYLWLNDSVHTLWGTGGPVVLGEMAVEQHKSETYLASLVEYIQQYSSAFFSFYDANSRHTVVRNFAIAPLFILTWLFLAYISITGDKRFKILFINIFLFLPESAA